jgi:23S rRNA pseudouridine1911/1915/1917 synthase
MTRATRRADYSATPEPAARAPGEHPLQLRLQIPCELAGSRLDLALARLLPEHSRSRLQDWIRRARVRVDGAAAQPKDRVRGGECIDLLVEREAKDSGDPPQDMPLTVVFEDAAILVLDKPAGLVVHPGSGNRDGTLLNALLHYAPAAAALPRAGIVHRLDKDTSGLLVVAKTLEAQTDLVRQLQARSVKRDYLAVVVGVAPRQGTIERPIGRHPTQRTRMAVMPSGKAAVTRYRVLRSGAGWSLLQCSLETGRTHQIRVHLASIGHALIGDPVYLGRASAQALPAPARNCRRQALHATRLVLRHPVSGETMAWDSPLPPDLQTLVSALEAHAPAR